MSQTRDCVAEIGPDDARQGFRFRGCEEQGKDDEAIDAWIEGAKLAGDLDLSPLMAAVTKLGELAKKASDNHDEAKAAEYRDRADKLLSSLADRAHDDGTDDISEPLDRRRGVLAMDRAHGFQDAGNRQEEGGLAKRMTHGRADAFRTVRGDGNAGVLCA